MYLLFCMSTVHAFSHSFKPSLQFSPDKLLIVLSHLLHKGTGQNPNRTKTNPDKTLNRTKNQPDKTPTGQKLTRTKKTTPDKTPTGQKLTLTKPSSGQKLTRTKKKPRQNPNRPKTNQDKNLTRQKLTAYFCVGG